MFENQIANIILSLIIAGTPLSLIASRYIQKSFLKYNHKFNRVSTICTEIIGTLTKAELEVKTLIINDQKIELNEDQKTEINQSIDFISIISTLCHYKKLQKIEDTTINFLRNNGVITQKIKNAYQIIDKIPSTKDKKISTIIGLKKETKEIFAFSKGNPKKVLEKCQRILINGKKVEITAALKRKLKKKIKNINKRGEKAIAFAYKGLPLKRYQKYSSDFAENNMVLVGIIGLGNFINKDLITTVEELQQFNIKIYLTSRTRERKAIAIGQELKIINPQYFEGIEKEYLDSLSDQKLKKILSNKDKDYIFSRLDKESKERIIKILKEQGEKVIISDKNLPLKKILEKVKNSRNINANQEKIYQHTLQAKIIEVTLIVAAVLIQTPIPISLANLVILDLLINTLLVLSIKNNPAKKLSTNHIHLILKAFFTAIIIFAVYLWSLTRFGWYPNIQINPTDQIFIISTSLVFLLLVIVQIINAHILNGKRNLYIYLTSTIAILIAVALTTIQNIDWPIIIYLTSTAIIIQQLYGSYQTKKHQKLNQ